MRQATKSFSLAGRPEALSRNSPTANRVAERGVMVYRPIQLFALLLATAFSVGEAKEAPLVFSIAGVAVGMKSVDPEVVALHGEGCFVEDEGHGGGRYFLNRPESLTLHTELGVDRMTEMVELFEGDHLPVECQEKRASAVSAKLGNQPEIDHNVRIGMSEAALVAILGRAMEPEHDEGDLILVYTTDVEKDSRVTLSYEAKYRFSRDRLIAISLYDGD